MVRKIQRQSASDRSKAYRANFKRLHGISFAEAQRLARAQGQRGAPASAVRSVTTSQSGLDLLAGRAGTPGAQAAARKAADREARLYGAARDVRLGGGTEQAERVHGLPTGSLGQRFSQKEITGGVNQPTVVRVLSPGGVRTVIAPDQSQRDLAGRHWQAVEDFLAGDENALTPFEGDSVGGVSLATDPDTVLALEATGSVEGGPYLEQRGALL